MRNIYKIDSIETAQKERLIKLFGEGYMQKNYKYIYGYKYGEIFRVVAAFNYELKYMTGGFIVCYELPALIYREGVTCIDKDKFKAYLNCKKVPENTISENNNNYKIGFVKAIESDLGYMNSLKKLVYCKPLNISAGISSKIGNQHIIFYEGQRVGFLDFCTKNIDIYSSNSLEFYINDLYIEKHCQRKGIGKQVVELFMRHNVPITLCTYIGNSKAIQFYEHLGFIKRDSNSEITYLQYFPSY